MRNSEEVRKRGREGVRERKRERVRERVNLRNHCFLNSGNNSSNYKRPKQMT